jgi:hypothetical protein
MAVALNNTVVPFPSRGGSGFRFSGKLGEVDLTNLYAFTGTPRRASGDGGSRSPRPQS